MIRRIQKIKHLGVFADFQWPVGLPEFKQCNLIYGWNYSGKTTLSRAFRFFEQKQAHVDFPLAQVQIVAADGTLHHLHSPINAPVFRVFNSDFVREHLFFDSGSATPILVLGGEDIAKQKTLDVGKVERDTLMASIDANKKRQRDKEASIDKALTKDARDLIKNPLGVPNYDKTRFEQKVERCRKTPELYLLDDATLEQCLSVYRSTDRKSELSPIAITVTPFSEVKEKVVTLLKRVVAANRPILRLKENPTLERWVNDGRPLHASKSDCQFCGQPLPSELLAHLTEHFSADYDNLMSELDKQRSVLNAARDEIIPLNAKSEFYPELQVRFTIVKRELDQAMAARRVALEKLVKEIETKRTQAFASLESPMISDPSEYITVAVQNFNRIIRDHNDRTAAFEKKRQEAFEKLEMHYAAAFVRDQKYAEALQEIGNLKGTVDAETKKVGDLEVKMRGLEKDLSEASKGAERINELLTAYFGKGDLRVAITSDKRFQIVRGSAVAKNLSEGEKTAIAFAYFITRVQDGRHPLADLRVVIDDPISSLDANHLFNTYALIKTQLSNCRQLFLSTHSFEFYNLLRDWVTEDEGSKQAEKPQANWKKWSVFLVKRTDDGKAVLDEIPKELLKFKSEYHYLFSTLYHFAKAGSGDFDCLLSLPNVVRRFMEAFGGIMIPLSTGLRGKMERLFPDSIIRERVWKFINHYSHNTTITRSLTIPDTSECRAVVQACLKCVRDWNGEYYSDLEYEVK